MIVPGEILPLDLDKPEANKSYQLNMQLRDDYEENILNKIARTDEDGLQRAKYFKYYWDTFPLDTPIASTFSDCHNNAQVIMGSDSTDVEACSEERPIYKGVPIPSFPFVNANAIADNAASKVAQAVLTRAFHDFFYYRDDVAITSLPTFSAMKAQYELIAPLPAPGEKLVSAIEISKGRVTGLHLLYKRIADPSVDQALYNAFSAYAMVNDHAPTAVGNALTQYSDPSEYNDAKKVILGTPKKDKWNFHWAGVIIVSGRDYVSNIILNYNMIKYVMLLLLI